MHARASYRFIQTIVRHGEIVLKHRAITEMFHVFESIAQCKLCSLSVDHLLFIIGYNLLL